MESRVSPARLARLLSGVSGASSAASLTPVPLAFEHSGGQQMEQFELSHLCPFDAAENRIYSPEQVAGDRGGKPKAVK